MNRAASIIGLELDVDLDAINPAAVPDPVQTTTTPTPSHQASDEEASANQPPNDADEDTQHLDLQHRIWRLMLGGALYLAPLTGAETAVLDISTSTKTSPWAIDFARENPECNVTSTSTTSSPNPNTQPTTSSLPPNITSTTPTTKHHQTQANALPKPTQHPPPPPTFDFTHTHTLLFTTPSWPSFLDRAWTHTKPGGWIQAAEPLYPIDYIPGHHTTDASALHRWSALCQQASANSGIDTQVGLVLPGLMKAQGFVEIGMRDVMVPVGGWACGEREKEVGLLVRAGMEGFVGRLARGLWVAGLEGWDEGRVEGEIGGVRADLADGRNTYYWTVCVVWGRKPFG
ncbi:hypothetical protein EJ05DRAFT_508944 [Pseudovirgaria hyperparasitica]|uniref:S-adenosyl-L-methionine-dependent methyltransferase n=1 Tax=Pseudovirgaria hyperparasitica TaxID=470096 RepID=A0A6A6WEE5_9PEZI|nr:uncharacterized protein EJ05DRAFT_508944 [Pseudovirgaria hyperparasitica]KAF2760404.1 hypothetical protein EJ05DRAFT_508944 [Pseudovirgaria hyperparasitica]